MISYTLRRLIFARLIFAWILADVSFDGEIEVISCGFIFAVARDIMWMIIKRETNKYL